MTTGWVRACRVVGLAVVAAALAWALLWAGPASAAEVVNPDGVAVIIGNRDYRHASNVKYAHRDAEAFRRYVVEVLGFDPRRILFKPDASLSEMFDLLGNRAEVKEAEVSWLLEEAENPSEADVVVFYSGHGVPGLGDKRGYLMPVDAKPDKVKTQAYPLDLLLKNVGKLGAGSVAVYVDACFSGNSETGMLFEDASPVNVQVRLPRGEGSDRVTLLTAATGDQLASWDTKRKQGLFTHHLLAGLRGGADLDRNGQVTAGEAKEYLDTHMTRAARRLKPRRRQTATLRGGKDRVLSAARFSMSSPQEFKRLRTERKALEQELAKVQKENAALKKERDAAVQARLDRDAKFGQVLGEKEALERELKGLQEEKAKERQAKAAAAAKRQAAAAAAAKRQERERQERQAKAATAKRQEQERRVQQAKAVAAAERATVQPGREFRDCGECPEMVVVPAKNYWMGAPKGVVGGMFDYKLGAPGHEVRIERPFAVGKYEVTFAEWDACVEDRGCGHRPSDLGWGRGKQPVVQVSWDDAKAYVKWLSRKTGEGIDC